MQGSIKKNKQTGKWEFVIDIGKDPVTGKRKQKRKRGFETKKDAEVELTKLLNELYDDAIIINNKVLFCTYMDNWFLERKLVISSLTYKNHRSLYKYHVEPYLGNIQLQNLNLMILQSYVIRLVNESNLSNSSINRVLSILNVAFKKAKRSKLIKDNPMENVEYPREPKKEMSIWTLDEINKFLQSVRKHRYYMAYLLAIYTGMRKGEILGLRWNDIDFTNNIIYIRFILDYDSKTLKYGTKTESGNRSVYISERLSKELLLHKDRLEKEKVRYPNYNHQDLVVCTRYGNFVDPASLTRRFQKQAENNGIVPIRFHDLRHSHATLLLQQNINPKIVSERLGHSAIHITLNRYSHVLPSMQKDVADRLNNLIDVD